MSKKPEVFIIVAETADGFIAKNESHPASWTSKEDKKRFIELTKKAGVMIMGGSTFKTLPWPLKDRLNIVYTRDAESYAKNVPHAKDNPARNAKVEITSTSPEKLIESLAERGYESIAICGGSQIYTMFMNSGLVDKIYLTIEPLVFGKGMGIFNANVEKNLKLVSTSSTEGGTIFAEYEVINESLENVTNN